MIILVVTRILNTIKPTLGKTLQTATNGSAKKNAPLKNSNGILINQIKQGMNTEGSKLKT